MKSETFQRGFLLLLVTAVSIVFIWMIRSFLTPLLLGAIFSGLARPLYLRFLVTTKGRKTTASALALLVFFLVILLPALGFVGLVTKEAVKVTENVTPWVQDNLGSRADIQSNLERLPGYSYIAPYEKQITGKIGGAVNGLSNSILQGASALTTGTLVFFLDFGIMLYAMFFFFMDGPDILKKIFYYLPMRHSDEKKLVNGFLSMARAIIKGIVVIGIIQGFLGGLAFWAVGLPSALFWGTVMAVMTIVPNVGAALIWAPGCLYLFINGKTTAAVLLLLWCALVVGTIDNILRPILIGKNTEMHKLLILISTLGGLALFGLEGFILGPGLALIFITVWQIYGNTFKDILPAVGEL